MSASYVLPPARLASASKVKVVDESALAQWFAVRTRRRFEKKVAAQLKHKGCEVFLPLLTERHRWSDRQKEITIPLFPGYAFVQIDSSRESRHQVLETVGLDGFVSFGGIVMPVPSKQIDDLQLFLRQKAPFSLPSPVQEGQRVRLLGGCLHGLEGIFLKHDKETLLISITSVQRSLAIEVSGYDVELI
jgi:transcription antitermination factor NusG